MIFDSDRMHDAKAVEEEATAESLDALAQKIFAKGEKLQKIKGKD